MKIAWDKLTVEDVAKILEYWHDRHRYYRAVVDHPFADDDDVRLANQSFLVAESRIKLWTRCLEAVTQRRPISPLVLEALR